MANNRLSYTSEFLDDNTPLPELSFEDLIEPTAEKGGQHMDNDARGSDDNVVDREDESLNTPQFKKTVFQEKRQTPGVTVLKSHAIKVVTAGSASTVGSGAGTTSLNPNKPLITDVKILNKLKPIVTSNTLKIGNTTIASTSTAAGTSKALSSMTQIKTPDGRVLFVQKSIPGTPPSSTKTLVTGSPTGSIRRIVAPAGIQKAVLSKGVAVAGTGLVKAAVPGRPSNSAITLKGITSVTQGSSVKPSPSSTASSSTPGSPAKFQVVRTTDGKIIKINQSSPSVLLNAKPQATVAAGAPSVKPTTANVVISKSGSQVVLKATPAPKPVVTGSPTTPTTPSKMVVQSGGKQILVSSKNIIKLSPKSSATTTASASGSASVSGLHAIQLPGKGGVQYVRVLSNNKGAVGATTATTAKPTPSGQKITLLRSPSGATATSTTTISTSHAATSVAGSKAGPSPASKIVVKSTGGSIVPLPSVQTFVSKRALSANSTATKSSATEVNTEPIRKHRLTDLNTQLKQTTTGSDVNEASDSGPEAKKPRYVITMQQGKPQLQSSTQSGTNLAGRSPEKESPSPPKKIYNVIKSAGGNGVKYMIRNPQTMTHAMRRGYTGYMDNKMRTSLAATKQRLSQVNPQQKKQLQVQAQAKQRIRQQQLQNQQQAKAPDSSSQTLPTQGTQYLKVLGPTQPLYDTLKPPASGTGAAAEALSGIGASRRKHCNCSKSQCLKLYCDCFANGEFCQNCTCKDCFNNLDYEVERERAIRSCLDRNPSAFKPKITAPNSGDMRLHNKGCNCKRSGCLKNYCECYEAKIPCTSICKCVGCRNMEDRPDVDMDSLDGVVGAETPSKAKGSKDKKKIENRSNLYLTNDVIEATIMCMISRIVMHEKQNLPIEDTEREVMEELGESLNQIISFAKEKHDTSQLDDSKATA
ncbi:protein lin-54 homolog isoform X1 [Drosophila bipectinata]|uniref:protein lin-54 homolog isoform X1 n=1 Tax=Drosophila bipectinata TaxID=42026 RepID=UPI001C8AB3A6|nr:protein lin-54 homolog isoform X1 [Drosophila bipectinata]